MLQAASSHLKFKFRLGPVAPDSLASNFASVEPHLVEINLRLLVPVGQGGIRHDNAHYNGHWHRPHSTSIAATILRLGWDSIGITKCLRLGNLIHFKIRTHAEEDP